MKLYHHPLSINARKARLAAVLSRVELDLVLVDIAAGAHKSPAYLALNPNGMIPTMDDDGFVLWESNAIAQYAALPLDEHPHVRRWLGAIEALDAWKATAPPAMGEA